MNRKNGFQNNVNELDLKNIAAFLIIVVISVYFLIVAKSILIPLVFGLLLSFLLHPIRRRIKKYIKHDSLSIFLSFVCVIVPIGLVLTFFIVQLTDIVGSLPSITANVQNGLNKALSIVSEKIPMDAEDKRELISNSVQKLVTTPLSILQNSVLSTGTVLFNLAMTILYAIFFLFYFKSFKNFLLYQIDDTGRPQMRKILYSIQGLTQKYLTGIGFVMLILAVLNSIGLAIIGIDYPIFWGCLAGMLAIIPYIGTTLGGVLPFLFALATCDTQWQPIAVVIYYVIIQQLEGNVITPKIVGDQVNINPLFALLSIIVLGNIWGVAGIVLSLPLIGMLRIVLEHIDATKPIAVLLGADIHEDENDFEELYNDDKYRISSVFKEDED